MVRTNVTLKGIGIFTSHMNTLGLHVGKVAVPILRSWGSMQSFIPEGKMDKSEMSYDSFIFL